MINIIQKAINRDVINKIYTNKEPFNIKINSEIIDKDLDTIANIEPTNKYDEKNIKAIIKYLIDIQNKLDDNKEITVSWTINKKTNLPELTPVQLISEPLYGINACNYIETIEGQNIVEIDLKDMANIIAFEIMHRDFGEDHDSIEQLLDNTGIMNYNKPDILLSYFKDNNDEPYDLSRSFKIGKSPYIDIEDNINDYFHTRKFKLSTYRKVVSHSCKYAVTLVADNIIKNNSHFKSLDIVMINDTGITVLVDNTNGVDIIDNIVDTVSIRVFGRKFKIIPRISIY